MSGTRHIFTANRSSKSAAFGNATLLNFDVASADFIGPFITPDGGSLYFATNYPDAAGGNQGNDDIFNATPPSASTFSNVPFINSPGFDYSPWILGDFSAVFFVSTRNGGSGFDDIWSAPIVNGNFGTPTLVPNINSPQYDDAPALTGDGLTLYLASTRGGNPDIFITTRTSISGNFVTPSPVSELNTTDSEVLSWISSDGCTAYVASNHAYSGSKGGYDLYRVAKPPL